MMIFSTIIIGICILILLEVFFLIDEPVKEESTKLQSSNTNDIEKRIETLENKYSNLKTKFVYLNSHFVNKNKGAKYDF